MKAPCALLPHAAPWGPLHTYCRLTGRVGGLGAATKARFEHRRSTRFAMAPAPSRSGIPRNLHPRPVNWSPLRMPCILTAAGGARPRTYAAHEHGLGLSGHQATHETPSFSIPGIPATAHIRALVGMGFQMPLVPPVALVPRRTPPFPYRPVCAAYATCHAALAGGHNKRALCAPVMALIERRPAGLPASLAIVAPDQVRVCVRLLGTHGRGSGASSNMAAARPS